MTWLYVPSMDSASVQVSQASNSDSNLSLEIPTTPSLTWRGKPMPPRVWSRECKKDTWTKLLCGTISHPLMAQRGVALWISSLQASRANPTQSQGSSSKRRTHGISGPRSHASSKSVSRSVCSSRTSTSEPSRNHSETFKRWASRCRTPTRSQPPSWVRRIFDVEYLPSPSAQEYGSNHGGAAGRVGAIRKSLSSLGITNPTYREAMMKLPIGWTAIEVLATQSFQRWQHAHLLHSQ